MPSLIICVRYNSGYKNIITWLKKKKTNYRTLTPIPNVSPRMLHWRITQGLFPLVMSSYWMIICTFHFGLYYGWPAWLQAHRVRFLQTSSVSCNSPSLFQFFNSTGNLEQPAYSCCVCRFGILALESCNFGNLCLLPYVLAAISQPLKTFLETSQNSCFYSFIV